MNNTTRILLRFAFLALLLAGIAALAVPLVMGPTDAARALGESCAQTRHGNPEQCSIVETLQLSWGLGGAMFLVGLIGAVVLRGDRPARSLDLSFLRS